MDGWILKNLDFPHFGTIQSLTNSSQDLLMPSRLRNCLNGAVTISRLAVCRNESFVAAPLDPAVDLSWYKSKKSVVSLEDHRRIIV
jgi:hypothetical protein